MEQSGYQDAAFYSRPGRVLAAVITVIAAVAVIGTLVNVGAVGLYAVPFGAIVIVAVYRVLWRPELHVRSDGVTVVNPLRTYVLRYSEISDVSIQWNLHLATGGRSLAVWAVPSTSNATQVGSARRDAYGQLDYDANKRFQTSKPLSNAEAAAQVIMSRLQVQTGHTP